MQFFYSYAHRPAHNCHKVFFSIESLEVSSKQFFYVYTYVHSLEFFMGTIVQLTDLMEAATWMTTSCTAALPSFSCAAHTPCHSTAACMKRRTYATPRCHCLCRAYALPFGDCLCRTLRRAMWCCLRLLCMDKRCDVQLRSGQTSLGPFMEFYFGRQECN